MSKFIHIIYCVMIVITFFGSLTLGWKLREAFPMCDLCEQEKHFDCKDK